MIFARIAALGRDCGVGVPDNLGAAMVGVGAVLPYQLKMTEGKLEKARATSIEKAVDNTYGW